MGKKEGIKAERGKEGRRRQLEKSKCLVWRDETAIGGRGKFNASEARKKETIRSNPTNIGVVWYASD